MTHTAGEFIGPLTLETLSRRRVMLDPLELLPDRRIGHIVAADTADAILVAPATARWMAAMANGLSDDVITATCLATTAPVIVAPAMDGEMYAHPATRANARTLADFGYRIVEPEVGSLASGSVGQGRLAELPTLVEAVIAAIGDRPVRQPDHAQWPPVQEPEHRPGPGGVARGGHRGWHRRAHRPGPLHRQSLDRPDGRRHRGGRAGPRRAG